MRYAIVKYVRHSFVMFLPQIGIELSGSVQFTVFLHELKFLTLSVFLFVVAVHHKTVFAFLFYAVKRF